MEPIAEVKIMGNNRRKIAVIGAGVGGLSSAALLSHRGYEVVVFERASHIGGKAGTVSYGDIELDTGPSLLTLKDEINMVFEGCGEAWIGACGEGCWDSCYEAYGET